MIDIYLHYWSLEHCLYAHIWCSRIVSWQAYSQLHANYAWTYCIAAHVIKNFKLYLKELKTMFYWLDISISCGFYAVCILTKGWSITTHNGITKWTPRNSWSTSGCKCWCQFSSWQSNYYLSYLACVRVAPAILSLRKNYKYCLWAWWCDIGLQLHCKCDVKVVS